MNDSQMTEQKRIIAEQIWLHYYNQVLLNQGMVNEEEYNKMENRINARASASGFKKIFSTPS